MKTYNIYKEHSQPGLGSFSDNRGTITDIFYQANMNHGCIITNEPGAVRGNHFHKSTVQYTLVMSGSLTYYSKPSDSDQAPDVFEAVAGDMIISEPNEIHTLKAGAAGCTFIAFAEGVRGGTDYESDTYRVADISSQ